MTEGRSTTTIPRPRGPGSDAAADRIFGVDAARGLALLGMFAAHTVFSPVERIWDGRSAILFATVAGVSLGLITGGARPALPDRRLTLRLQVAMRGALLIVIGILLALLDPPLAVILDYYGFAFVLLVPALFASRVALAIGGFVLVAVGPPVVAFLLGATTVDDIPVYVQPPTVWLVYGSYPMLVWIVFLLAGLLGARADLRRRRTQLVLLGAGALAATLGYGAAALLPGVGAEAHSGTTAEVIGSGGVAVGVIAALTLLGTLPAVAGRVARLVLGPLAAAGAMALTLYTAHVLVLTLVRSIASPDDGSGWEYPSWLLPALILGALAIGTVWRRLLGSGPLETAMRLLTTTPVRRRAAPS